MSDKKKPTKSLEVKLSKTYKSTEVNETKLKNYIEKISKPSNS